MERKKISVLKICDKKLFHQQSLFSILLWEELIFSIAAISSDGCAILLMRNSPARVYELWEFSPESGWELDTTKDYGDYHGSCLSLTGTRNSRTLIGRTTKGFASDYFLLDFSSIGSVLSFRH